MATVNVVTKDGSSNGSIELNDAIFGMPENPILVHEVAVALMAAQRQGNAETKTRKQIRGGGRKPYRQKGTGNARHGSTREPQMRGGGVVFGPHKRSYRKKTPAGFRRKALCVMLSDRLRGEALHVVDELSCETPKTKPMAEMCAALAPGGKKTLLVTPEADENVYLSARNIPGVSVRPASELNALDVLHARHILLSRGAVAKLEERLA